MENIKKLVVLQDEDNIIKQIVYIDDNGITRESDKYKTQDELNEIYQEALVGLEDYYNDLLIGLDEDDKKEILLNNKVLIVTNEKLITHVFKYKEPKILEVLYDKGKEIIKESDCSEDEYEAKHNEIIEKLCLTYLTPDEIDIIETEEDLFVKLTEMGLYDEYDKRDLKTIIKNFKISNINTNKKILAGLLASALVLVVGVGLSKTHKNKDEKSQNIIESTMPTEEPTSTPYTENTQKVEFLILDESTVEPNVFSPTPTPYTFGKKICFENEEYLFDNYEEPVGNKLLVLDTNKINYYGLNESFENVISLRNQNMDSLENKIQSNIPLEDEGYYIYFENMFNNYDITEKAFVKYFSMFGNQIIKCGYVDNNYDFNNGINKYAKNSCYEVVRCIRDNQPLTAIINGQTMQLYYSNLSNEAKIAILNIAWSNYTVLNSNPELYKSFDYGEEANIPEIDYNGEILTKSDIADILITAYEELSITK